MSTVAPDRFEIVLTMESDWHVGTGYGAGGADRAVRRDAHGLPFVPGKTLKGMLRDACEEVAYGLDEGDAGPWHEVLEDLFGDQPALRTERPTSSPLPSRLSVTSAHFPEKVAEALACKPVLASHATFIKAGVRISQRSGRALDKHLRFEEMARAGAVLHANAAIDYPCDPQDGYARAMFALLVAGLSRLQRIGGKRRRGAGRVRARVNGMDEAQRLSWIKELESTPSRPHHASVDEARRLDASADSGGWVSLRMSMRLLEPVCVQSRVVGNLIETKDRIPGYVLLPALFGRLRAAGVDLRGPVARGDLQVSDATVSLDGAPTWPMPRCFAHEKSANTWSGETVAHNLLRDVPETQVKRYQAGYIGTSRDGQAVLVDVRTTTNTHNTIDDDTQRPSDAVDTGGLYSIQAIEAGTQMAFEVRMPSALAEELARADAQWPLLLEGQWRVGSAKSAEYGLCEVSVAGGPEKIAATSTSAGTRLTAWLLSPVLVRDRQMRPSASPEDFARAVGTALGRSARVTAAFAAPERIESWQRSWGLPRPTLLGLAPGSCIEMELDAEPDPSALAALETRGIGERRAEGFGRVCFNHPLLDAATVRVKRAETTEEAREARLVEIDEAGAVLDMERAAWRAEIAQRAAVLAADRERRKDALGLRIENGKSVPPLSQVAALREVLSTVASRKETKYALDWLEHLGEVTNRLEKWGTKKNLEPIKGLLEDTERVWTILDADEWAGDLTCTKDGVPRLKEELWAEAVRTVADAFCRAHKRETEKK